MKPDYPWWKVQYPPKDEEKNKMKDAFERHIRLEFTTGGHNKFYEVWMEQAGGNTSDYQVVASYGKIGGKPLQQIKYAGPVYVATAEFQDLVDSKKAKGYKEVKTTQAPTTPTIAIKEVKPTLKKESNVKKEVAKNRFGDLEID